MFMVFLFARNVLSISFLAPGGGVGGVLFWGGGVLFLRLFYYFFLGPQQGLAMDLNEHWELQCTEALETLLRPVLAFYSDPLWIEPI